jgi:hypothetical protein
MIEKSTGIELIDSPQEWLVTPNNESATGTQPVNVGKRSKRRRRSRISDEVLNAVWQSVLAGDSLYQTVVKTNVGMNTVVRIRKEVRLAKAPAARCS